MYALPGLARLKGSAKEFKVVQGTSLSVSVANSVENWDRFDSDQQARFGCCGPGLRPTGRVLGSSGGRRAVWPI